MVAAIASTSIGSPSAVPVPCASTKPIRPGSSCALASASRISASWAGPFGAASSVEWPSWFTAEPRMTARILSPSAIASDKRLRTTMPQPSPRPNPSARCVEGLAAAIGRHEPDLGHRDHEFRRDHQRDATGDRHVGFAEAQALAGQVDGDQRRRAGGVDRDARAAQVEEVRQAIGEHAVQRSGQGPEVDGCRGRCTEAVRSRCGSSR